MGYSPVGYLHSDCAIWQQYFCSMSRKPQTDILEIFGSNLLKKRNVLGLGQRDFAILVGIDNADISRMENARVNVTLKTVHSIAEKLKINTFELLIGDYK